MAVSCPVRGDRSWHPSWLPAVSQSSKRSELGIFIGYSKEKVETLLTGRVYEFLLLVCPGYRMVLAISENCLSCPRYSKTIAENRVTHQDNGVTEQDNCGQCVPHGCIKRRWQTELPTSLARISSSEVRNSNQLRIKLSPAPTVELQRLHRWMK